ncbi:hypothetical protein BsWGS_17205 [Bradybaena similaris]
MASNLIGNQKTELYLKSQMEGIPHFVDLDIPGLTQARLLSLLENAEEENDVDDVCQEETIFKLNFMSWVYIKLAHREKAEEINDRVIAITRWENVMSVANHVFLRWKYGKQEDALIACSKLQEMRKLDNFKDRLATAKAELAYCYSRVGGPVNLFKAIDLFQEAIGSDSDKLYWKLRLGLAYRRCTHLNIYTGMTRGPNIIECVEKAAKHLTDVYRNNSAGELRGPAISELAMLFKTAMYIIQWNDIERIFGRQSLKDMCNLALECAGDNTWVLSNCGKLLRSWKQMDRAVEVLQRCLCVRKHTTTHHQLGLCYMSLAQKESRSRNRQGPAKRGALGARGRSSYPFRQRDYRFLSAYTPLITLPNENFSKAEFEYLEAIKLSHDRNLPAVYDLGQLYKLAGRYQDALDRFNQVTNSPGDGHLMTVIKAYEQSGLCYLLMGNPKAEDTLTKAISLAVVVASTCPQLQNCTTELWQSFRTKKDRMKTDPPSPSKDKILNHLSGLVRNHKHVVKIVEDVLTLNDSQIDDPDVIGPRLRGYLQLNEFEKAFGFLNMVSVRPKSANSETWETQEMIDLRHEVLLRTAENRLKLQSSDARFVCQELFKLRFGQCTGRVSEDSIDISNSRDVLLFYDEDHDTEELSQISQTVHALQRVLFQVFGLDTSRNLQGSLTYGPKMAEQLEEIRKYQVVVVVLGEESTSPEFATMTAVIPNMASTDGSTKTVLVLDACREAAEVPDILQHCPRFRLQQILGVLGRFRSRDENKYSPVTDTIREFSGDNLQCLMRLFRFVIGLN